MNATSATDPAPQVVITGVGAWTPHGVGWPALWTGLLEGRHAFEPVGDDFGPDPRLLAGRIRDLQPFRDAFPSVKPPLPISVTRMAMVAAQQALAGLDPALRSNYGVMLNRSRGPARVVADIMKPLPVPSDMSTEKERADLPRHLRVERDAGEIMFLQ